MNKPLQFRVDGIQLSVSVENINAIVPTQQAGDFSSFSPTKDSDFSYCIELKDGGTHRVSKAEGHRLQCEWAEAYKTTAAKWLDAHECKPDSMGNESGTNNS